MTDDGPEATTPGDPAQRASPFRPMEGGAVRWRVERDPVPYPRALEFMEARVDAVRRGAAPELAWLVEHPPLYTAGTAAGADLPPTPLPLHRTGRGGQVTYHGPGQRVVYLMLDLETRSRDVRAFVGALEDWIIAALAELGVVGERRADRVGVWVRRPDKPPGPGGEPAEDKVAALGIRIRRWVTFHGISLNVDPDLGRFRAITPCGIADAHLGVTSLVDLRRPCCLADADAALRTAFEPIFGPTVPD